MYVHVVYGWLKNALSGAEKVEFGELVLETLVV